MVTHEYVKKTSETRTPKSSQESDLQKNGTMSVNKVRTTAAGEWLVQAAMDIHASRYQSLLYGLFFVLMGLGIDSAHEGNAAFAVGLSAAFMFTGPFLSIGLYELSRQIQEGEKLDLWLSMFSWCKNPKAVGRFAFYLSVIMVVWLWLSTVLMTALHQPSGVLFAAILLALWAALAIVVFMASVVAIPMMLDRPVSAVQAVRFSLRCCRLNSWALCLWASIVACGVGLSLALGYWPLLLVGPLLGHATWHAYRDMLGCQEPEMSAGVDKA